MVMNYDVVFFWVLWNTFLAAVPVAAGWLIWWLAGQPRSLAVGAGMCVCALVWLAFLPNTCYLLTEWRHYLTALDRSDLYAAWRSSRENTLRLMLYTAFYFCFSGVGVLSLALSIRPVEMVARRMHIRLAAPAAALFLLSSLGVYLGLVLRYNSWDILARPMTVWASVAELAHRPVLSGFIVAFAVLLWLEYVCVDIWIDGLVLRWRRLREGAKGA